MTRMRRRWAVLLSALIAMLTASVVSVTSAAQASGATEAADPQLSFSQYATVSPAAGWSFVTGFFDGDTLADVVGYHPSNGSVWLGRNTGSSFVFTRYATMSPAAGWSFVTGQFDLRLSGGIDLVAYHPVDGGVWVGRNTGSSFDFTRYATVSPTAGWAFTQWGLFPPEGTGADLVGYHPSDGSVWRGDNTGSSFVFTRYATVSPAAGWSFVRGYYTGDIRRPDLLGYHPSNGSVWLGSNTGSSFAFTRYATVSPAAGWSFVAGEFFFGTVIGYHPSNGSVWRGRSTGSSFAFTRYGTVSPAAGWSFLDGPIVGQDPEVVGYHPSNGSLWVARGTG